MKNYVYQFHKFWCTSKQKAYMFIVPTKLKSKYKQTICNYNQQYSSLWIGTIYITESNKICCGNIKMPNKQRKM